MVEGKVKAKTEAYQIIPGSKVPLKGSGHHRLPAVVVSHMIDPNAQPRMPTVLNVKTRDTSLKHVEVAVKGSTQRLNILMNNFRTPPISRRLQALVYRVIS